MENESYLNVIAWGSNCSMPILLPGLKKVRAIACKNGNLDCVIQLSTSESIAKCSAPKKKDPKNA